MVTQFHTLLHFVTQNHTILSPTACAAASTRKPGVSKSHLLSIYVCKRICYKPLQRGLCTRLILHGRPSSVKTTLPTTLNSSLAARMPLHQCYYCTYDHAHCKTC